MKDGIKRSKAGALTCSVAKKNTFLLCLRGVILWFQPYQHHQTIAAKPEENIKFMQKKQNYR